MAKREIVLQYGSVIQPYLSEKAISLQSALAGHGSVSVRDNDSKADIHIRLVEKNFRTTRGPGDVVNSVGLCAVVECGDELMHKINGTLDVHENKIKLPDAVATTLRSF